MSYALLDSVMASLSGNNRSTEANAISVLKVISAILKDEEKPGYSLVASWIDSEIISFNKKT